MANALVRYGVVAIAWVSFTTNTARSEGSGASGGINVKCPESAEENLKKGFTNESDPPWILPYNVDETIKMCGAMSIRSHNDDFSSMDYGCNACCTKSLRRAEAYRGVGVPAQDNAKVNQDIARCKSGCGQCVMAVGFSRGQGRNVTRLCLTDSCNTAYTGGCFNVDQWAGTKATLGGWDSGYKGCNSFTDPGLKQRHPDYVAVEASPPPLPPSAPAAPRPPPVRPGPPSPPAAAPRTGVCCYPRGTGSAGQPGQCWPNGNCDTHPENPRQGGPCVLSPTSCPAGG